ncbi:MAG: hypothetical protein LBI03_03280 [Clostridiales bacterium]|jgi:hypothetical protein|nr:hypothetical protein [Clostridiales bacterium]
MKLKKQNGLTKLKKINVVDPEKNTAKTMAACRCNCVCIPDSTFSGYQEGPFNLTFHPGS